MQLLVKFYYVQDNDTGVAMYNRIQTLGHG